MNIASFVQSSSLLPDARRIGRYRPAFSLVELIIVVVIVGLLAAIAIPRLSRGTAGAAESTLRKDLKTMRTAIDMYKAEHGGTPPGKKPVVGPRRDLGTVEDFNLQMFGITNADGRAVAADHPDARGPYLATPPRLNLGENAADHAATILFRTGPDLTADDGLSAGWLYNPLTGQIIPNTEDTDRQGNAYQNY